ncbi:DivIVA domain-containing protein [Dactylosporangium sp. NPDC049140]
MTQFTSEFRGYDRAEVDKVVQTANDAIASSGPN